MRIPGSWTVARPFGVPVRIHWSVLLFAFFAGQFKVAPGAWLAYLLLVLIHEAGHAIVVRRVGARAIALDVLGMGGLCWWEGDVTPLGRACIAWGGIWAQMVVLAVTCVCLFFFGHPKSEFADSMVYVATMSNAWLIGMNLLPIPPLDGKDAWTLFPLLWRRIVRRRRALAASRTVIRLPPLSAEPPRSATATTRASATVRVIAPRLDPRQIQNPTAVDVEDIDESSFTPEVEAVLDRARAIARDAAKSAPEDAAKTPSSRPKPGAGDPPPPRGDRDA